MPESWNRSVARRSCGTAESGRSCRHCATCSCRLQTQLSACPIHFLCQAVEGWAAIVWYSSSTAQQCREGRTDPVHGHYM